MILHQLIDLQGRIVQKVIRTSTHFGNRWSYVQGNSCVMSGALICHLIHDAERLSQKYSKSTKMIWSLDEIKLIVVIYKDSCWGILNKTNTHYIHLSPCKGTWQQPLQIYWIVISINRAIFITRYENFRNILWGHLTNRIFVYIIISMFDKLFIIGTCQKCHLIWFICRTLAGRREWASVGHRGIFAIF